MANFPISPIDNEVSGKYMWDNSQNTWDILLMESGSTPVFISQLTSTPKERRVMGYFSSWGIYGRRHTILPLPVDFTYPTGTTASDYTNMLDDGQLDRITHLSYSFMVPQPSAVDYQTKLDNGGLPFGYLITDEFAGDVDIYGYASNGTRDLHTYNPHVPEGTLISADYYESFGMSWNNYGGSMEQMVALKQSHPHIKQIISVGGWTMSWHLSTIFGNPTTRGVFIDSCVTFFTLYPNLDGLDIDWEYPGYAGEPFNVYDPVNDKIYYGLLMQELREAFDLAMPERNIELSIAVSADPLKLANVLETIPHIDTIGLMSYDFFSGASTSNQGGIFFNPNQTAVAPSAEDDGFYLSAGVEYMLSEGVSSNKIMAGSPAYGRGWVINDANELDFVNNDIFATAASLGNSYDPAIYGEGHVTNYRNILTLPSPWVFGTDTVGMGAYAYNPTTLELISYENLTTLQARCDYLNSLDLAGVMVWDVFGDDPSATKSLLLKMSQELNLGEPSIFTDIEDLTGSVKIRGYTKNISDNTALTIQGYDETDTLLATETFPTTGNKIDSTFTYTQLFLTSSVGNYTVVVSHDNGTYKDVKRFIIE